MFGESESESPRVGSPWDSLLSSGASTPSSRSGISDPDLTKVYKLSLPKLVPEAEEGNVEYKLQLIEPSPERFLRLVTQLKWRLLEGGGQAYYELGVADSGQLVGLTRQNLERSLETLEAMAGEIGASVVVVKEIEVPPSKFEPANSNVMLPKSKGCVNGNGRAKGERTGKSYRSRPSDWGAVEIIRNTSTQFVADDGNDGAVVSDIDYLKEEICLTVRVSLHPSISELAPTPPTPSPISPTDDDVFPFDTDLQFFSTLSISDQASSGRKNVTDHKRPAQINGKTQGTLLSSKPEAVETLKTDTTSNNLASTQEVQTDLETLHTPLVGLNIINPETTEVSSTSKSEGLQLATTAYPEAVSEPRLIVEALVVRKLSADEVFLDFGGFSLAD